MAEKVNKNERKSTAEIENVAQGKEPTLFWKLLGSEPPTPRIYKVTQLLVAGSSNCLTVIKGRKDRNLYIFRFRYTERQCQLCDDASDIGLIESNGNK